MTQYNRVAIDISKAVFTLHGVDENDQPSVRVNLRRGQLLCFSRKLPPTWVAMEACGGAHHRARALMALGHTAQLIPAQYVKPYLKRGKNDRNDAEAICEAASRPGMRFVPVKTVDQQARGMILKVRDLLIGQRTQLANALRGHATEFGVVAPQGLDNVVGLKSAIDQDETIPTEAKAMVDELVSHIDALNERISQIDSKINAAHMSDEMSQRLTSIPGVGPVIAMTLVAEIDPAAFESGRHLADWAGLTPREHSTGGKRRLGQIGRAGNERLRALLVTVRWR